MICRSAYGVTTYPYNTEEVIQLYGEDLYSKLSEKRIGADKYPLVKSFRAWAQPDEIIKQLETGKPYPIKGVWTQANNWLANQAGDPRRHYNAIKDLDFNVVVDLFMTPTAQAVADIVLPAASFPEKDSIYCIGGPLNIIEKVIDVADCKSDWEINFTLAKRLNPKAVPWNSVKEMLTARMLPSGYTFESLGEKRWDLAPKDHPCGSRPYRRYEKGQLRKDKKPGFQDSHRESRALLHQLREVGLRSITVLQGAWSRKSSTNTGGLQGVSLDHDDRPAFTRPVPQRAP